VVVAGLGGIFVEILRDVTLGIPPLEESEARAMVHSLRGLPLLEGARGGPAGDLDAFVDVLVRLSSLAIEVGDALDAIDLNPIIVRVAGHGVAAVDALVVRRT
jgi:acyl-CoA synthetase (NDP forming)